MKLKNLTLQPKFIVIMVIFLLAVNIIMGVILTTQSKTDMKTLIDERMLDVSKTAASLLDGDDIKLITGDKTGDAYQRTFKILKQFQNNIELEFIYVIRPVDGKFIYIVDPADENVSEYGEEAYLTAALGKAATGLSTVDKEPYTDRFGHFYSAYSPVFDSTGKIVGIVGVDFAADWYDEQLATNTKTILSCGFLSLIMIAIIILTLIELRRRFQKLTAEFANLDDDLEEITRDIIGKSPAKIPASKSKDELNEFGEKIQIVREEIRNYINDLKTQANNMIKALSSNYRSVYYVNLDADECTCYQKNFNANDPINEGETYSYKSAFEYYAAHYVAEDYRKNFLNFIEPENVRAGLKNQSAIAYRYLAIHDGQEIYEMLKMACVHHDGKNSRVNNLGVGFTDIDAEVREDMAKNQALSDALKTAEGASKAKTLFLSNMSHEIRTPMNTIIGLGRLALHEPNISDKIRDYLEKISGSAQHLLSLINDILDMSRIESGRMVIKQEEFSFAKLVEQINTIADGQCKDKKLIYDCRIIGQVDDAYIGDSIKLRQVLINLLGNAIKFTPESGTVELIVEKTAEFDGQSTLKFVVKDTGIGMSKEYLPKIFEAFSQENSNATNKYGSTGLGMAITKNIVDLLNGEIFVESEKGVGTAFTVVVTLRNVEKVDSDEVTIRPQDLNVLAVDDDPIVCENVKLTLEQHGIAVDTVLSGKEALAIVKLRQARREPYNLIIVDWKMPELDGIETTRQIRELIGSDTAIIILTSYNRDEIIDEALSAGVDSFIAKPLFVGNLLDEFKHALKKRHVTSIAVKSKADLTGRKILLAEDMPVNAEIMMMVLQMREIEADHAEDGKIALEMFAKSPENYYAAILMDMRMPHMDGLEATQAIRALDRPDAKKIPIIALTANAFDEDVQRSLQAGLNAHLSKPVEPEILFATLETIIEP